MPVRSMTGFGRASGQADDTAWIWEIRTVNNRGLDIRLRLPQGLEDLELRLKELLGKQLKRGSCSVNLTFKTPLSTADFRLNESAFLKVLDIAERARVLAGRQEQVPLASLLALKGVMEAEEGSASSEFSPAIAQALLESFQAALDEVVRSREAEGQRLQLILETKLGEIRTLTKTAEKSPERTPEAIATRLRTQILRLQQESTGLDETRLHQEAVLLATKADIEEEVQRLHAHIASAHELIADSGPIGRRLEFLAQEFQREANTLCSKSNATEITRIGLSLKSAIDQVREQVQNVE